MKTIELLLALLVGVTNAVIQPYTAYDCVNGAIAKIPEGWSSLQVQQFKEPLTSNGLAKMTNEQGVFSGSMFMKMRNEIFRIDCTPVEATDSWNSFGCFSHAATIATTKDNRTVYVDDDRIILTRLARTTCRPNVKTDWARDFLQDKLETKQAAMAGFYDAAKTGATTSEKPRREAMKTMTRSWHEKAYDWYKKHISKALLIYGLVYMLTTVGLTCAALTMKISLVRSLRISIPLFRRFGDMISYKRDKELQEEAKTLMETRERFGLGKEPDIQDFAITHIKILYRCIQTINKRLNHRSRRSSTRSRSNTRSPKPGARSALKAIAKEIAARQKKQEEKESEDENSQKQEEGTTTTTTRREKQETWRAEARKRPYPPPPKPKRNDEVIEMEERRPNWRKQGEPRRKGKYNVKRAERKSTEELEEMIED